MDDVISDLLSKAERYEEIDRDEPEVGDAETEGIEA